MSAERQFLHDMINPLSTADLVLKKMMRRLESGENLSPEELEKSMGRIARSIQKMMTLCVDRRKTLSESG